jgi:hypothetical protein
MAVQYAFGKIVTQGLDLALDAADPTSYPGTGTTWTSVVNRSITGTLTSCSYSSDFKGGIVFASPSASVQLPGTVANYGTGSFTIEVAFRPTQIQGIHYLVSKNSGSFPNWGVYLSGSGGSGKLFSFYNVSSTVSCSVSSSTTFVTGSNYFVDTVFDGLSRRIYINNEGNYDAVSELANGTGSLTTTGSLFIGNFNISSSQPYSGSIFSTKIYSIVNSGYNNFKSIAPRVNKPIPARASSALALIVGGGGSGGNNLRSTQWQIGGGGGGGGVVVTTLPQLLPGTQYNIFVGDGSTTTQSGSNSFINSVIAYGGGGGGQNNPYNGLSGSSGGGGTGNEPFPPYNGGLAIYGSQGFNGGSGSLGGTNSGAGGGGGAGQIGSNGVNGIGGKGGDGIPSFISGQLTYYGGGGGGAGRAAGTGGTGGLGGGGTGGTTTAPAVTATTGSPNTGGGGGGGDVLDNRVKGGSGIVIIRYPGPPIATGGTITSVSGDTIHTFTATGSSTFTVF